MHLTQIKSGRVVRHMVVAPTEWNFHPRGAFAAELTGMRIEDEAELARRAELLAQSLDPCVSCQIELRHA